MKPDIIVCWPRNNDYPLWRQYIHLNRSLFNEIIIVFTETNFGEDYREFVKQVMFEDRVQFVEITPVPSHEDWRNWGIHQALLQSYNAEWVWFTEQDFFPSPDFWHEARNKMQYSRVVGIQEGERIHPACLFMKRDLLTSQEWDFGIIPDRGDHFIKVVNKLMEINEKIDFIPPTIWEHLNGLSHNWSLIERGDLPNWNVERFNKYLEDSLKVEIPLDPKWENTAKNYFKRIKITHD